VHGIPSPHHSPGPALSIDSAAALTPINDEEEQLRAASKSAKFLKGKGKKQLELWDETRAREEMGNQKQDENGLP
jgi:hypothetical protein